MVIMTFVYLRNYLVFPCLTIFVLIALSSGVSQPVGDRKGNFEMIGIIPDGYKLTFSDEFDTLTSIPLRTETRLGLQVRQMERQIPLR